MKGECQTLEYLRTAPYFPLNGSGNGHLTWVSLDAARGYCMAEDNSGQILALSGGGYRGLYTAKLIALLEEKTGLPFARHFDLLAGTSIGGILALALACEISAAKIVRLFEDEGDAIFKLRSWGISKSKYSPGPLKRLLSKEDMFGDRTLADCRHAVVVPAVNYTTGNPQMFKTAHHPRLWADKTKTLVDVALATSAAPIYFPRHVMNDCQYVDGGLIANAPGIVALHEVERYLGLSQKKVRLLSIGTMSPRAVADPSANRDGGLRDWGRGSFLKTKKMAERLFALTISSNETLVHYMLEHRLDDRYRRIDENLSGAPDALLGLDNTSPAARELMTGRAIQKAQSLLGDDTFLPWIEYRAKPRTFYYPAAPEQEQTRA